MVGQEQATDPAPPVARINVARVFDAVDPETGPSFAPDHPTMDEGPELNWVLAYLDAGTELLVTAGTMTDVIDPDRGSVVPMTFRTDGAWIWTDTVTYYLAEYGIAPDPDLLEHIQAAEEFPAEPDEDTIAQALWALNSPVDEPVWQVDAEDVPDADDADRPEAPEPPARSWLEAIVASFDADELRQLDSAFEKAAAPLMLGEVGGSAALTQQERELVVRAQQLAVISPGTRMRKTIEDADVERYLSGQRRGIRGFVIRAQDAPNSQAEEPESYGIEFRAGQPERYRIPLGAPYGANSMRTAQDPAVLRAGEEMMRAAYDVGLDADTCVRRDDEWPYTGIGVSDGVPQRYVRGHKDFEDGDVLYRYLGTGEKVPLATFDGRTRQWVRQS